MKIGRGVLTGAGLLLLFGLRLAAQGVDLAAMRKAEEERRKKITKSGVVLDDKSVKNVSVKDNRFSFIVVESSGAAAPPPGTVPPPSPAATGDETTDGKPSAQDWKARKLALEQRVADLRQQIASSQSQLNRMQSDFLLSNMASEQNRLQTLIDELRAAIVTQQGDLKSAEQDLVNFANEARRAGVPPGWLR